MPDKFQNKYRISSARLENWDYGWHAAYFVTICTQNRVCYFGDVHNGIMQLSPMGAIANVLWNEIKNHAQNIELDEFIVMPNHIHGIIILNGENVAKIQNGNVDGNRNRNGNGDVNVDDDGNRNVETRHALSLPSNPSNPSNQSPSQPTIGQKRFQNQGKNTLSSIVGSYKSAVTKHANRLRYQFGWQSRFHDHVIRDPESFERIKNYIINNPENWNGDKFKLK